MSAESPIVAESSYSGGVLSSSTYSINDEDIIAVVEAGGSSGGFKILSLRPTTDDDSPFELRITPATILPKEFLDRWLYPELPSYLQEDHLYTLISTRSGTGLATVFSVVLQTVLEAVGVPATKQTLVETQSSDSIKDFTTTTLLPNANHGRKQTVLLLSGDGGIVEVINAIGQSGQRSSSYQSPIVVLFPLGTGNASFHSIHQSSTIPSIYVQGLRTLLRGTPKPLPIFQAKFSPNAKLLTNEARTATPVPDGILYGAVVASYGLHATLVADSDTTAWRQHGDKRFGMVAQNLLSPADGSLPHAYKADVTFKNGSEERIPRSEHGYILLTLVAKLERTFTISPDSEPLDGKLRIVHFGPLDGKEVMNIMGSAYDGGKHVEREEVGYNSVQDVRIDFKESGEDYTWRRVCIDGSIVAVEEGGWVEVSLSEGEVLQVVV